MKSSTNNVMDVMMDGFMKNVEVANFGQELAEKMVESWMSQSKRYREDVKKTAEQMVSQAKTNQENFEKLMNSTWERSVDAVRKAQELQVEEMKKQVNHWNETVDRLAGKAKSK